MTVTELIEALKSVDPTVPVTFWRDEEELELDEIESAKSHWGSKKGKSIEARIKFY